MSSVAYANLVDELRDMPLPHSTAKEITLAIGRYVHDGIQEQLQDKDIRGEAIAAVRAYLAELDPPTETEMRNIAVQVANSVFARHMEHTPHVGGHLVKVVGYGIDTVNLADLSGYQVRRSEENAIPSLSLTHRCGFEVTVKNAEYLGNIVQAVIDGTHDCREYSPYRKEDQQ